MALLAGILIFTALLYVPTLLFEFVYDDRGQIVENTLVHSWRFVPEYFQGHVWQYLFPNAPANYYRPLNVLWLRTNHALFGLNPMGWHASAILLHLTVTALVFFLVRRITGRPLVAAATSLVFGVHPMRHEVVAWVSGTTESLCAVLFLSTFLAYLKSRERCTAGWMSLSCLLYAAGLLAKETALVLPALVFAHAVLYGVRQGPIVELSRWQRLSQAIQRASFYLPIAVLYLAVRIQVLHGFSHAQTEVPLRTLFLTLPSVLLFYMRQWLLPVRLSPFYDVPFRTQWDVVNVLFPAAMLVIGAAGVWFFRRKLLTREVAFALAWMSIPLLPALNLSIFPLGELVHDRYFYLPGLGAALLMALALQPLATGRLVFGMPQRLTLVILGLIVPLAYSTANASSYWADDYVLFEHARRVAPENAIAQNNYAIQLPRRGDYATAVTMLQRLVDQRPDYFLATYNLGRLLYELNLLAPAEHYLKKARAMEPELPDTYLQLGLISMKTNRLAEAESLFRRAVALHPRQPKFHFALGVALVQRSNCTQARSEFSEALHLDPAFSRAREQMEKCGVTEREPAGQPQVHGPTGTLPAPSKTDRTLAPVKGP
jgi:Flp pilus assembly protein TadD